MKKAKYPLGLELFLLILGIGTLISSCAVPHYMYAPTAINVPSFTEKGESSTSVAFSNHGYDIQGGYSISNRLAVLGSWYWRHEKQYTAGYQATNIGWPSNNVLDSIRYNRKFLTAGVMFFTPINPRKTIFFNLSTEYGLGQFNMFENKRTETYNYNSPDTIFTHSINNYPATMTQVILQPSIMVHSRSVDFILSFRWSGIRYHYNETADSLNHFGAGNNTLYSFLEPALTWHIRPVIKWLAIQIQMGLAVPAKPVNFEYHAVIGNVGVAIDPVGLLRKKVSKKENESAF